MRGRSGMFRRMVDSFEIRGVYVPGEEDRSLVPDRDFGWLVAGWLVSTGLFVVFFAIAV